MRAWPLRRCTPPPTDPLSPRTAPPQAAVRVPRPPRPPPGRARLPLADGCFVCGGAAPRAVPVRPGLLGGPRSPARILSSMRGAGGGLRSRRTQGASLRRLPPDTGAAQVPGAGGRFRGSAGGGLRRRGAALPPAGEALPPGRDPAAAGGAARVRTGRVDVPCRLPGGDPRPLPPHLPAEARIRPRARDRASGRLCPESSAGPGASPPLGERRSGQAALRRRARTDAAERLRPRHAAIAPRCSSWTTS